MRKQRFVCGAYLRDPLLPPPLPPPFLMKMIPVALIDNNNTKQLKAMGGWREEKRFS